MTDFSDLHRPSAPAPLRPEPLWILSDPPSAEAVSRLVSELHLPEPLCALLALRGLVEVEAAKRHLRPRLEDLHPPEALTDAPMAVERLLDAVRRRETILVHGDYDVDGVCSTTLYTLWLRRLGATVVPFVPHRLRDGYDFGEAGLRRAEEVGAGVVLTADCGTVAHAPLRTARGRGLDVLVTDHHTPSGELPPAVAVVNPNRPDCSYPDKRLCGAGIAFKVCQLLAREAGVPQDELLPHLDLVALATVADLVPLEGENHILVRYGLRALGRTSKPGLRALLDVTGITDREVDAGKVGFVLAPRINAVGRMGDASDALRLLLTEDAGEAAELAQRLDAVNRERQAEDRRTLAEACQLLEREYDPDSHFGVVLAAEGWHPGVIGIVASRVVERIHRPVVLVALDGARGRGSGRSIPGFHLHDALAASSAHLERFGGHRQAAGLDVRREALPAFKEAFQAEARRVLEGRDLRPALRLDLEISPADATVSLVDRLRYLGPHGMGNPRPVFVGKGLELAEPPRVVGSGPLRLRFRKGGQRLDGIGFRMAERVNLADLAAGPVDAAFQLQVAESQGGEGVQGKLMEVRPPAPPAEVRAVAAVVPSVATDVPAVPAEISA